MTRITVLDDYQRVALGSADWSVLAGHDIVAIDHPITDVDELVELLAHSEVVVAMRERTRFPASTLARLPELGLLVTTGMANAAIDLAAAAELGITVCGTGGSATAVGEAVIGMMIALPRGFAAEDRNIREGGWQHTIGPGLAGHTLGLVGLGRQGSRVARLARAFDMRVTAWSPHLTAERAAAAGVVAVSREEVFAGSDYVSVHVPLDEQTRGLISAAELALMHPGAYLINSSRGPVVDEAALLEALRANAIAGAALDVYDIEPLPADHPLRSAPRTLLPPHLAYVTTDTWAIYYGDAVDDVVAWLAGSPVRQLSAAR